MSETHNNDFAEGRTENNDTTDATVQLMSHWQTCPIASENCHKSVRDPANPTTVQRSYRAVKLAPIPGTFYHVATAPSTFVFIREMNVVKHLAALKYSIPAFRQGAEPSGSSKVSRF
jgi:hypothetical protein